MSKSKFSLIANFKFLTGVFFAVLILGIAAHQYDQIKSEQVTSWTTDTTADCAVVLTGGSNRVREGFDLLYRNQVKKLIVSGVNPNAQLREIMPQLPFYGDLNEKDVVLDRRSGTTYGNAQQTLPIVEALRCRDVALITSSLHMSRAYRTFKAAYPLDFPIYKHAVTSGRSEVNGWEVSTEVLKSMFYSLWAY